MQWIVFSYSLPTKARSSPRVAIWRRLRRLGALALAGGIQVLPARAECVEAFQWLAQEIRQAQGEAVVMRVEQFEGLSEQQLVTLFHAARQEEYTVLEQETFVLEQAITQPTAPEEQAGPQETLAKLRRRYHEIAQIDYFHCPEGAKVAAQLARIAQALAAVDAVVSPVAPATLAAYRETRWVTRSRPHVDRLACAWLIRRFINPHASIRYAPTPEPHETAFDMSEGTFSHHGPLCTFETMVQAFRLPETALQTLGELVHEIDLRDGRFLHPETAGIEAILNGWLLAGLSDQALEAQGITLFEGLYLAYQFPSGRDGDDNRKENKAEQ
jgi:hypothetical protein